MYQRVQRGRGLGGFFGSVLKIFSKAAPLIKKVAANPSVRQIGKQALNSALSLGASTLKGEDVKSNAKREFTRTKKKVSEVLKQISVNMEKKGKKRRKSSNPKSAERRVKKNKIMSSNLFH